MRRAPDFPNMAAPRWSSMPPRFPAARAQFRRSICRHGSIAGPSPQRNVLPTPAGHRRHDRGGYPVQGGHPWAHLLQAFAVMPNHVHILATPSVELPKLTRSLKGITAKRANAILRLTGKPFWQAESYDHLVRNEGEFEKIRRYIEENPVRAGLVSEASEYRWSSAGGATRGAPADRGAAPHL